VLNEWCLRLRHGATTGVDDLEASRPRVLALSENVPNPFNPATRITVDVPGRMEVHVLVYDVSGRRVATLLSGLVEAGSYELSWQGRNEDGRPVASGLYFCRLEAEGRNLTRRMLLLK
jgi:hypothetical protein